MQDAGDPQKLGAKDQSALDLDAKKELASHTADVQTDAAKATTNLQMKTAEQAHGHAMEATNASNKHEQMMAKLGHPLQAAAPAAAGASPTTENEQASGKTAKRFSNPEEVRSAMQEAYDDGFIFVSSLKDGGGMTYRYLNPDRRELLITFAPEKS